MIFISQFTDERERTIGLAFRECLMSEGGRTEGREKKHQGNRTTIPPRKCPEVHEIYKVILVDL